jgi:hypothetical protein
MSFHRHFCFPASLQYISFHNHFCFSPPSLHLLSHRHTRLLLHSLPDPQARQHKQSVQIESVQTTELDLSKCASRFVELFVRHKLTVTAASSRATRSCTSHSGLSAALSSIPLPTFPLHVRWVFGKSPWPFKAATPGGHWLT